MTTSLTGTRREAPHIGEGSNLALEHGQAHRALALGCPRESQLADSVNPKGEI